MKEVVLYIATSLDGYIADITGGIYWLPMVEVRKNAEDYGYHEFLKNIDAIIMGSKTYEQILEFGDWPYPEKKCWVFSNRPLEPAHQNITITSKSPKELVKELEEGYLLNIWLVGGATLISEFRKEKLINKYIITIIPLILGDGIPLFIKSDYLEPLTISNCKSFPDGLIQVSYISNLD